MAYIYVKCQRGVKGHAWDDIPYSGPAPDFGVYVQDRCMRCGGERKRRLSRVTGQPLTGWSYSMPQGYSWTGQVDEKPTPDEFRLMYLNELDRRSRKSRKTNVIALERRA